MVGAGQGPVEREVLLDDRRSPRHRSHRDLDAEGVIGETHRAAEARGEAVHGAQVHLFGGSGIGGQAVEHGHGRISRRADRSEGLPDLVEAGHARGEDDGPALGRHVP